jgi:hypothetical protein
MVNTKSVLVVTHGFFGDILFASSIAERFVLDGQYEYVDFVIGFPQMQQLMNNNPFIRNVYVSNTPGPTPTYNIKNINDRYDAIIRLGTFDFTEPPPLQVKRMAGCKTLDAGFTTYIRPEINDMVLEQMINLRNESYSPTTPIITVMSNWQSKAFSFTEEEYWRGIDVPYKGYGGRLRNIPKIIDTLSEQFCVIPVGLPDGVNQYDSLSIQNINSLEIDAAIIKNSNAFVGAEGGLANIAYGVRCPTILDSAFVWQLYGPNGVIRKVLPEPQLGPRFYEYTGVNHVDLNPYLNDEELCQQIIDRIEAL